MAWGCVPSLLFDLGPNYGGGNEDNGDLLLKVPWRHCSTQYPLPHPCSRLPLTHDSVKDSWTLTGKFGSGLLSSESCEQGSVWSLQESVSQVQSKFWWLCGVVNGDLLQESLCHTQVCCTQSPCPCGRPLLTHTSTGDTQTVLPQSPWGLWVLVCIRCVWALWASLVSVGFDSTYDFAPPAVLLGLLWFLCPWTWGISSQLLQHHATSAPAPPSSCSLHLSLHPESNKYASFDILIFLYIPGQYSPVFNISFILHLHLSLENWTHTVFCTFEFNCYVCHGLHFLLFCFLISLV